MRTLKGKKPELITPGKPKVLVFGRGGVGKTHWACRFPKVYYIDTEGGGVRDQYRRLLTDSGGAYFGKDEGSQDFMTVIREVETLATVQHEYLTLVIDSFTQLYLMAAAMAENRVGSDYGRDKKEANRPTKQLLLWIERLDMNVILVCHRKQLWKREGAQLLSEGYTFDAWDKMEYLLDLCVEVELDRGRRFGTVRKTRYETLPINATFEWSFEEFAKRVGEETIMRKVTQFQTADPSVIKEIKHLIDVLKVDQEAIDSILTRASVTELEELDADKATKTLLWLRAKIKPE